MEYFDSYRIEVYIGSAWVDITADVFPASVRWNRGAMGNGPLDRVGSPGYMRFSLDNSSDNSAGLEGRYSPQHTNVLTGWTSGIKVRLCFTFETLPYYKFFGKIKPDGIQVESGSYGSRRVHVTAHDWMAQAGEHELHLMTLAENQTIEQVVPLILANMPVAPLATNYETGTSTFPTVFDTVRSRTTANAEFLKLALSELGAIYVIGDRTGGETLRVEGQLTRSLMSASDVGVTTAESGFLLAEDGTYLLAEDGTRIILDQVQTAAFTGADLLLGTSIPFGRAVYNRVEVITYPRKVDAAATTILWTLQKSFKIEAGATKSGYTCRYRDPSGGASYVNGRDMVAPVATTHYTASANEDGTGANLTPDLSVTAIYGTEAVEYELENTGATDLWVQLLKAVGKGIYIYDAVRVVYNDAASQLIHGVRALTVDMRYQEDPAVGELFAVTILGRQADPDYTVDRAIIIANKNSISMMGFLQLEPGRRLSLSEDVTGIDRDFFVQGYEAEIIGMHNGTPVVQWMPVLQWAGASSGLWVIGTSALGANTTLGSG